MQTPSGELSSLSTWMIVEDEPDIYALLLAMFDVWGIEGIAFVDGEEAFRWMDDVERGMPLKEPPELALLDVRLPGEIDGTQVGGRLRSRAIFGDPVIVLITAYRLSNEDERAIRAEAGADLLFYKPLPDLGALRTALESTIAKRRAARQAPPVTLPERPGSGGAANDGAADTTAPARPTEPTAPAPVQPDTTSEDG